MSACTPLAKYRFVTPAASSPILLVSSIQGPQVFRPDATVAVFERADSKSRKDKLVAVETDKVVYSGRNNSKSLANKVERTLVFALNRKGKTATLLNSDPHLQNIITLSHSLPSLPQPQESSTEMTFVERNNNLVDQFGSRKRKRAMEKYERNKVTDANMVGREAVAEMLSEQFEDYKKEAAVIDNLLPVFDVAAETPRDAYPLDSLLSRAERDSLSPAFVASQVARADGTKWGLFVDPRLREWATNDAPIPPEQSQLALFYGLLVRFYHGPRHFVARDVGPALCSLDRVVKSFAERFADRQAGEDDPPRFTRSVNCSRRLVLAILVTALHLEDFSLSKLAVDAIAADLKMEADKLAPFLLQIGCSAHGTGSKRAWALTVPLEFPQVKQVRKRPKRG